MSDNATPSVLYLTPDGLTDPLGQSQILPYLNGLARHFTITVVSFEKKDRYELHRAAIQMICRDAGIQWVPLRYHSRPPVLSTMMDLQRLKTCVAVLQKRHQFKIVHARSYLVSLVAVWMKKKFGVRFLFDMRGFWADERIEGGIWKIQNPIYRRAYSFFKKKEKIFLQQADHIISLTHNARNEILSWKIAQAEITVIPTCVDLSLFNPAMIDTQAQSQLRAALKIDPADFVVIYVGSTGTWYRIDDTYELFREVRRQSTRARLLFVTKDNVPSKIKADHDAIICSADRREVPLYLSLARVSVCLITPSFSKKASAATKMAESWAMNVPVITNRGWGDVDVLSGKFPLFYFDEDRENSVKKILKGTEAVAHPDMSYFDLANGVKEYTRVYRQLLQLH